MELVEIFFKNLIKFTIITNFLTFFLLLFFTFSLLDLELGGKMKADPYPQPWFSVIIAFLSEAVDVTILYLYQDGGTTISAFRAVGSQNIVSSPAVKPGLVPLASGRSPQVARRRDSSDQVDLLACFSLVDCMAFYLLIDGIHGGLSLHWWIV